MTEVKARGPNFVYTKKFIIKEYGPQVWEKLLASLPADAADIWLGPPLANMSYPFTAFKHMVNALSKEIGNVKETETARLYEFIADSSLSILYTETARLYEFIADSSLSILYKAFFHFSNPSFVIKNYPKLWVRFFEAGKVEVPVAEKGHAIVKFTLPEIFLDWISPACLGYSKKAVEMAGGKNLTMQQKSKSRLQENLWEISYVLKWDE
ncbi:MAG: hypothetical protein H6R43_892 [Nitrospirae bacterium]|nr:hypothetical protein [Nitrospirota bacterium]